MAVDTLRCRVCEAEYPAVASGSCARCFGPLEPVYDWDELTRTVSRESIEAGPRSLWRYEALLPTSAPRPSPRSWITWKPATPFGSVRVRRSF